MDLIVFTFCIVASPKNMVSSAYYNMLTGDPLAPLLFNIVAEGLTRLMREAVDKSLFSSFLLGKNHTPVNIL